jgi:hypothetical protein
MKIKPSPLLKLNQCIAVVLSLSSCTKPVVDLSKETEVLSLFQKQEQTAHLNEEPALLVHMLNDTLTQIKNGVVSYYSKDQMTERFKNYFDAVEFIKWEDTQPPKYTVSEDGTMAHILICKQVEVKFDKEGATTREVTYFAWTELWKKKDGKWKMYSVTTTDKEGQ